MSDEDSEQPSTWIVTVGIGREWSSTPPTTPSPPERSQPTGLPEQPPEMTPSTSPVTPDISPSILGAQEPPEQPPATLDEAQPSGSALAGPTGQPGPLVPPQQGQPPDLLPEPEVPS